MGGHNYDKYLYSFESSCSMVLVAGLKIVRTVDLRERSALSLLALTNGAMSDQIKSDKVNRSPK